MDVFSSFNSVSIYKLSSTEYIFATLLIIGNLSILSREHSSDRSQII